MRLLAMVLLFVLLALPAAAGDLEAIGEDIVETVELSLVGGTFGWGGALYAPTMQWKDLTLGPFLAVPLDLSGVGGGLGGKLAVEWDLIDNLVNWVGAGLYLERGDDGHTTASVQYWLGRSFKIK